MDDDDFGEFTSTPSVPYAEAQDQASDSSESQPSISSPSATYIGDTTKCDIPKESSLQDTCPDSSNDCSRPTIDSGSPKITEANNDPSCQRSSSIEQDDASEESSGIGGNESTGAGDDCRPNASAPASKVQQIQHLISKCFQLPSSSYQDVEINKQIFAMQSSDKLWNELNNFDCSPALKLRWPDTRSFQILLESLAIDPRNILQSPSAPFFAADLRLLEPMKGNLGVQGASNRDGSRSDQSDSTKSTVDSDIPKAPDQNNGSHANSIPSAEIGQASSKTSPVTGQTNSLPLLDFDIFLKNGSQPAKQNGISHGLSSDFDAFLGSESQQETKVNNPLEKILPPPPLTEEARSILNELPNISYMRADYLMFPVKENHQSN